MAEYDPLVLSYVHLAHMPRAADALHTLKKVASLVKPIMRARGWKVRELAEFYPHQENLLGILSPRTLHRTSFILCMYAANTPFVS